jgi:hypothetical protein
MTNRTIYKFDRPRWLEQKSLADRRILFLDLNYWINLAQEQNPLNIELRNLLSEQVSSSKIICPVSPSLLLELKKRPQSDKRNKYCQLMDELSEGVSLRNSPAIFKEEFRAVIKDQTIDRYTAYSHFIEALLDSLRIEFPESGWGQADIDRAADLIFDYLNGMSIVDVVDIEVEDDKEGSILRLRNGLSELCKQGGEWREKNRVSRRDIEQAEFASTARSFMPIMIAALLGTDTTSLQRLSSENDKAEILKRCPTFWCEYHLMAELRIHKAQLKENDLWDLQHVASALPYVDCVACDNPTRHLCSDVLRLDKRYGTTVISTISDLKDWITGA